MRKLRNTWQDEISAAPLQGAQKSSSQQQTILTAAIAAAVVIVALVLIVTHKKTFNLADYIIEPEYTGIKAGETITVTADADEYELSNVGIAFSETTKELKCTEVEAYVSKISDISKASMEKIKKEADDWSRTLEFYSSGKKMYSDLITANLQDYTYEVSKGLKGFGD